MADTTITAPHGAICAACGQPCQGELVEVSEGLKGWYMHADEAACLAAWEAAATRRARLKVFVEVSEC